MAERRTSGLKGAEAIITGLAGLVRGYFATTLMLLMSPSLAVTVDLERRTRPPLLRPLTYLTLASFVFSAVGANVIAVTVLPIYWGFHATDVFQATVVSLRRTVDAFSLVRVISGALPFAVGVFLFGGICGVLIDSKNPDRRSLTMRVLSYAVGFQLSVLLLGCLSVALIEVWGLVQWNDPFHFGARFWLANAVATATIGLVLFIPGLMLKTFFATCGRQVLIRHRSLSDWVAILLVGSWTAIGSVFLLKTESLNSVTHSVAPFEAISCLTDGIHYLSGGSPKFWAIVHLVNHETSPMFISRDRAFVGFDVTRGAIPRGPTDYFPVQIADWSDGEREFMVLKKDEAKWLKVQLAPDAVISVVPLEQHVAMKVSLRRVEPGDRDASRVSCVMPAFGVTTRVLSAGCLELETGPTLLTNHMTDALNAIIGQQPGADLIDEGFEAARSKALWQSGQTSSGPEKLYLEATAKTMRERKTLQSREVRRTMCRKEDADFFMLADIVRFERESKASEEDEDHWVTEARVQVFDCVTGEPRFARIYKSSCISIPGTCVPGIVSQVTPDLRRILFGGAANLLQPKP